MLPSMLIVSLLAIYPHTPSRTQIDAQREQISIRVVEASIGYGVPASVLVAVGFFESRLGTDRRGNGSWGAPCDGANCIDRAASALALGYRHCRRWRGAVNMFRNGRCRGGRFVGYTPDDAMRLAARLGATASVPPR